MDCGVSCSKWRNSAGDGVGDEGALKPPGAEVWEGEGSDFLGLEGVTKYCSEGSSRLRRKIVKAVMLEASYQ